MNLLDQLEQLHAAATRDSAGWNCEGCQKLKTRCRCAEIAFEALPALLRLARAAEPMAYSALQMVSVKPAEFAAFINETSGELLDAIKPLLAEVKQP